MPVLSDPAAEDAWEGRTGLVHEAILADYPDLAGHRIYACGSVKMVEAAQPAFAKQGLSPDDCFSDAFKLAPRIHAEGSRPRAPGRAAMNAPLRYGLQVVLYGAFAATLGYFSTSPAFEPLPAGHALIRLSLNHAGQRKVACRTRTRRGAREARAQHARGRGLPPRTRPRAA